jgi:hypothetical protein
MRLCPRNSVYEYSIATDVFGILAESDKGSYSLPPQNATDESALGGSTKRSKFSPESFQTV